MEDCWLTRINLRPPSFCLPVRRVLIEAGAAIHPLSECYASCKKGWRACISNNLTALSLFFLISIELAMPLAIASGEPLRLTQLDHKVWTPRDGAPTVTAAIALDHDGTLWLAGESGLYQFDGLKFTEFHAATGKPQLPGGGYVSVFVAKNGDVWAGAQASGIARIRNGQVRFFDQHDGFPVHSVMYISEAPDGSIYAVVHASLMMFDGHQWMSVGPWGGTPKEAVRAVFFDREGRLWVSTNRSIYYRSNGQHQFVKTDTEYGRGVDTSNFAESRNGDLWIATLGSNPFVNSDLRQIAASGHRSIASAVIHLPFIVQNLAFSSDGSLWVAGSELNRFEPVTINGKQDFSRETFGTAEGLTSPQTEVVFADQNGDMWVGTDRGIDRFQYPVLIRYVDRKLDPSGIGLTRDSNGTIWIASGRSPLLSVRNGQTEEHGPALSNVATLFADDRETIWAKTDHAIIRETRDHATKVDLPEGVPVWTLRQFFQVSSNEIDVVCLSHGALRLVDGKWLTMAMPNQPAEEPFIIFIDGQGRIWIGYANGEVGMVNGSNGLVFPVGGRSDLGSVQTFIESSEGLLAAGLDGIAVFRGNRFEILRTADPHAITGISGMVQARNGDLWLNGIHGVVRIASPDLRAAISRGIPMRTQLETQTDITGPPQDRGFPTAVSDSSGRIWFNTSGVIAYVDPEHIPHNRLAPIIAISDVEEDGQAIGSLHQVKAGTSTIRIPYFGANLYAPEKVTYMYRLQGVDKQWQDVNRRTEAVYTHLGPGKYLFEVKAANGEAVWSGPASVSFTVLPFFYQTLWFKLFCILTFVLLLWLALTLRVRYLAAAIRQRVEQRTEERISIARDLHDTLLQGVQGLLLTFHAAAHRAPAEHDSKKAMERALALADRLILEGRDSINHLRSDHLTSGELEPSISEFAEDLTGNAKIEFALEQTGTRQALDPEVMDQVFFIAREALTNAYRHSDASRIVVAIDYGKRQFKLECRDDGRGFENPASEEAKTTGHWGLRGMAERAQRIDAEFFIRSAVGEGVQICVVVPAARAYERGFGVRALIPRRRKA